jgi:hypothetical protein
VDKEMNIVAVFALATCFFSFQLHAAEVFADFDSPGKPSGPKGVEWRYTDQMLPVTNWEEIIPGDGFAYLKIDADRSNDRDQEKQKWPSQMIQNNPGLLSFLRRKA